MTLLIVLMNDAERNASRVLVLLRRHTAAARTPQLPDLPEELITGILLRLPARTLVSLRSCCTSWRNLISSPDFTCNHFRRSCLLDPNLSSLRIACYISWPLLGCRGARLDAIGVLSVQSIMENPSQPAKGDYFKGQTYYIMVGSCHGLLCFFDEYDYENTHGVLWNPCTGFTFETPQISGHVCLCGFGYDHVSDTYKLFGFVKKELSTRIYTFGPTPSWRRIDDIPFGLPGIRNYHRFMPDNMDGVFFSSSSACTINWSVNNYVVVYFDLSKETYGHFSLPITNSDGYPGKMSTYLCVLRNCLSVCYQHLDAGHWCVWQMKEYRDAQSWTQLAIIPSFRCQLDSGPLRPLYISESDVLLAISPHLEIVLCNLNDGSIDFPMIDRSFFQSTGSRMAYIYHESLVSPNGLQSNSSKMRLRFIQRKPKPKPVIF